MYMMYKKRMFEYIRGANVCNDVKEEIDVLQ